MKLSTLQEDSILLHTPYQERKKVQKICSHTAKNPLPISKLNENTLEDL